MREFVTPECITGKEIKQIRTNLGLTQKEFADLINTSVPTVERWEVSVKPITGPVVLVLNILREENKWVKKLEIPEKKFPVRMWYMFQDKVCTLIDVDEIKKEISIKNYTDKIMFRAFGVVETPGYEEYEEWLESRCFPRERDKMKLMLKELGIPFYDPMLIIEKTQGRMEEDDFWIKIER